MSHQPYEDWILDLNAMPEGERRTFQAHLEGCPQCQALQRKWQAAHRELRTRAMISPAPGFTQRWQSGLAKRQAREARRQALKTFIGFLGGAILILLGLAVYVVSTSTPADWLAALVRYGFYTLNLADTLVTLVSIWLRSTPLALNIALWIYLAITLCLLSLAWVFALWRTSILGVNNQ